MMRQIRCHDMSLTESFSCEPDSRAFRCPRHKAASMLRHHALKTAVVVATRDANVVRDTTTRVQCYDWTCVQLHLLVHVVYLL